MGTQAFQTTYSENQDKARVGMFANTENQNTLSRTVETAAGIAFGVPVARGAADRGCIIMAASQSLLGVSVRHAALDPGDQDKFAQYKECAIADEGVIWVQVEEAVTAGAAAYWNPTTGKWSVDNTNDLAIAGCTFDGAGSADDLVPLRVRL